jgi:hypothetical protein
MMRMFKRDPWSLDALIPPWGDLKSIYEQIRNGLIEPLPDEHIVFKSNDLRWVGGAMDGVLGHHAQDGGKEKRTFEIVHAVQELQRRADHKSLSRLYDLVVKDAIVGCIDPVRQQLRSSPNSLDKLRVLEIGRYFAVRAGHREAVKFGLALIGVFGTSQDSEILKTLGKSEEFTVFSAVALAQVCDDPEQALWELARNVHGWGRIQIVERLKNTDNSKIQAWMLREGFRNNIMNEYLACICARAGKLHEALNQQLVDTGLLDATADILTAMINGGPAEGIDDYEFAADASESYLNLVWAQTSLGLGHFLTVANLRSFLDRPDGWEKRRQSGWTDSRRKEMQTIASDVFHQPAWRQKVNEALASDDEQTFCQGDDAAQLLSMDTWALHLSKIKGAPLNSSSWYRLMQQTDESRVDEVLNFAESVLPFDQIETGPGDELGLGPDFRPHQTLDWILQDLRRFPNRGWRFISVGLHSPVVRNRNMAIQALAAWPLESLSPDVRSELERARDAEPKSDIRQRLDNLLGKQIR